MVMEMQHETCNIQHLRSPSGRLGMKPALLRGLRILLLSKSSLLVLADLTMSLLLALWLKHKPQTTGGQRTLQYRVIGKFNDVITVEHLNTSL